MPEGANFMEYLITMTSLADQLREMKEEISSKKFATVILGSLPESYDGFISSLSARASDELDWDKIKGLLVEEYMKQKERSEQQPSVSNDALFTRRGFQSRRGNLQHGNGARPAFEHREESRGRGPKCYKCKRFGHIAKQCPQNKKFDETNVAIDCQEENENSEDNIALASTTKRALSNGWYVDSGATSHMTYDGKSLLNFRDAKIPCYDKTYPITLTLENVLFVPKLRKNLMSVAAMAKKGAEIKFDKETCTVIKDERTLVIGHIVDDRLYKVNTADFVNVATSKDEKKLTFPEDFNDSPETPVRPAEADLDDVLEEERRAEPVGVNYEDRFLEEVRNLTGKRNRNPPGRNSTSPTNYRLSPSEIFSVNMSTCMQSA
eukprot:gene16468-18105_t